MGDSDSGNRQQAWFAKLERVFAEAPDAVLAIDGPSGCVVLANAAACALTGYAATDLVGRSCMDLYPPAPDAQDATEARLHEQNAHLERRIAERTAELTIANLQLTRSIDEANQRAITLQNTGQERTQFFAGLAHEMRTPLNAVVGLADLLTDMKLDDEARHTARLIHSSARALVRLINDLLDHSRLEANKLDLVRRPYNLRDLLGELADITKVQCDDLGLTFALQADDGLPDPVLGDEGRLRQVLMNLLGNALKFTREGGVTLHVRRLDTIAGRAKVEFRLTDTGVGIPADQLARLFQPYSQAAAGVAAGSGSSGLGLAISRMLVERMGGHIGVESDEGWGSTFWFTLPLEPAREAASTVIPSAAASPTGRVPVSGRTALVVDDNRINQQVALGMLKRLGVSARTADGGQAALAMLADIRYDVVFMDVQMPGLDGLEATRRLRNGQAGELNCSVPVIAMTGNVTRQDRQACTDAGMNDYVAKPISGDRLQEAIVRVLTPAPADAAPAGAEDVAFDLWALAGQLNGDREMAAEIFTLFLDDAGERVARMDAAVRAYDCDTVVLEAKTMEGAALNVHAGPLARQAAAVGAAARHRECEYAQALIAEMTATLDELATAWRLTIG